MPQVVFNYEMNKSYPAVGKEKTVTFRITLEKFEITGPNGKIDAERIWNQENTAAVLRSDNILPSESDLELAVSVTFEELLDGTWHVVKDEGGQEMRKVENISFHTGPPPDYIPESNVVFSYPSANMLNFYKNEHAFGYLKLGRGQEYLFKKPDFDPIARFVSKSHIVEVPMAYIAAQKEVTFKFPDQLEKDQVYELILVTTPKLQTDIESNISTIENVVTLEDTDVTITTRSASGSVINYEEIEYYDEWYFRTSKYNTFSEKVANVNPSSGWRKPVYSRVHRIGSNFDGPEPFSLEEIYGRTPGEEPLIQMVADLKDNRWFKEDIEPLVYIDYPFTFRRNPTILGKVPTRAVYLYQYPYNYQLEENHILSGHVSFTPRVGRFDYELAYIMFQDFSDLQWRAARSTYNTSKVNRLLTASFPTIRGGDYSVDIQYRLPERRPSVQV